MKIGFMISIDIYMIKDYESNVCLWQQLVFVAAM